jgi:hypothetical protein
VLQLNVTELLLFFDEAPVDSVSHASAIVAMLGEDLGIALLQKRLRDEGIGTTVALRPNGLPQTPMGAAGRLDRWLLSDGPKNPTQYQVEVKNWSAHAINGKKFTVARDAPEYEERLRQHRISRWAFAFNPEAQSFWNSKAANKVLTRMTNPPRPDIEVEPLICFWDPMHPADEAQSLFKVDLKPNEHGFAFDHFWVFSMSNYLRGLTDKQICLDMPAARQRIQWLGRLAVPAVND